MYRSDEFWRAHEREFSDYGKIRISAIFFKSRYPKWFFAWCK